MFTTAIKVAAIVGLTLAVGACASHTVRVKCDGPLRPINALAPRQAGTASDAGSVAAAP